MSTPPNRQTDPGTIFVVEPEILVRMVIAAYLRECGFTVIEGATAEDVITVLGAGKQVEFVFAEVKLTGSLDGFGLAKWVRDHHPRIDVLLTSGASKAAEKAGELCDEGPLDKPYHPQEVMRRINILLERRRTSQ